MANEVTINVKAKDDASRTMGAIGVRAKTSGGLMASAFKVGAAGAALAAVGVIKLAGVMRNAGAAARESQKIHAQTAAVLKSTGGAANIGAKGIEGMASRLSKLTGVDDEVIQSGENMLLTFTNIRNDVKHGNMIFDEATQATLDLSVAMGKDMSQSAVMVGKALNDPIKGITALKRVGVTFNAEQEKTIQHLVKTGKTAEAQKIILAELRKEFGGSAEAQATWADKAKVAAGNVQEAFGKLYNRALAPIQKFFAEKAGPALEDFADKLNGLFSGKGMKGSKNMGKLFESLKTAADEILPVVKEQWGKIAKQAKKTGDAIAKAVDDDAIPAMNRLVEASTPAAKGFAHDFGTVIRLALKLMGADAKRNFRTMAISANLASNTIEQVSKVFGIVRGHIRKAMNDIRTNTRTRLLQIEQSFWNMAIGALKAAQRMFSWIPGMKGKFATAIAAARHARAGINAQLNAIQNHVPVRITFSTPGYAQTMARINQVNQGAPFHAAGGIIGGLGANHAAGGGPRGGRVWVGEQGPELVDLPMGSHVNSNPDSMAMAGKGGRGGKDVHFHFHGPVYGGTDALVRELVNAKRRGQLDVVFR